MAAKESNSTDGSFRASKCWLLKVHFNLLYCSVVNAVPTCSCCIDTLH